jgi:hypothetical protein
MANEYILCPACGLEVPDGRFCKFCGNLLHSEIDIEQKLSRDTTISQSDEQEEIPTQTETTAEFDFSVEGMSSRQLSILLSKVELAVLARELDVLIEQIRATRHALQLEHADKLKIASRAESLKAVLEKTKARRKELLAVKGRLEFENTLIALEEKQSKIALLEDLTGSIEQEVYDEKHSELHESIKSLKSQLRKEKKVAKDWIKAMEKKTKSFHKELSRLTAQHKIGDISSGRFEKLKTNVTRSISILDGGCKILQGLIEQSETLQKK